MDPRKKRIAAVVLIVALVGALITWLVLSGVLDMFNDRERLITFLEGFGSWSAVVLMAGQALQVLIPFIPSQLLGLTAGFLYGTLGGLAVTTAGMAVGSWVAIWLARRYGRPFVERTASPKTIDTIDAMSRRYGVWAFFLIALVPVFPTDVGCFVAGLTPLPKGGALLAIVLGRMPGLVVLTWLGYSSQEISLETMVILTAITLGIGAIMVVYRDSLERVIHRWLDRLGLE